MTEPRSRRARARWGLGAMILGVALLVGLTLHGLRGAPPRASMDDDDRAAAAGAAVESAIESRRAAATLADETPPWEATPENTGALPAGTVPAWQVEPPRPDSSVRLPPAPVEPLNPATHRPPLHNPGGVNGDRPERSAAP